jgi:D-cysteine desulfhydrase
VSDLLAPDPGRAVASRHLYEWLARPPACLGLAELPTPVERAGWLDRGGSRVWIKRDERTSALYGGGKVRKLEWVLANPPHAGERPILTIGAWGSHHLLACALFLRGRGRPLHAIVFDQSLTEHVERNLAALVSLDTQLWAVESRLGIPWALASYHLWRRPARRGRWLTPGASTAVGSLGSVEAGLELAAQIEAGELPRPDRIYVAAGTAGTGAGLALGLALAGVATHLRLVSAVEGIAFNRALFVAKLGAIFRELVRRGLRDPDAGAGHLLARAGVAWSIDHGQVGRGYAVPTAAGREAVAFAAAHGLVLETTYTGKCLAALRADQIAGAARPPERVLLWNTHGANDVGAHVRDGWEDRLPPGPRERLLAARRPSLRAG